MTKKPGRPKGSKTNNYPVSVAVLAVCPNQRCGATDYYVLKGLPVNVQNYAVMHNGVLYERIEKRKVRCNKCNQLFIEKTFAK